MRSNMVSSFFVDRHALHSRAWRKAAAVRSGRWNWFRGFWLEAQGQDPALPRLHEVASSPSTSAALILF